MNNKVNLTTKILQSLAIWIVQQEWFQKIMIDKIIQVSTKTKDTTNTIDDKVYDFIYRNKRDLLAISKREAKLTTTLIDDNVIDALQLLLDNK